MKEMIVWGAYGLGENDTGPDTSRNVVECTRRDGEFEIIFWVDNSKDKWGKSLYEKPVYQPKKILEYPQAAILINSLSFVEICDQIRSMGGENSIKVIPFYWYSGTDFFPYDKNYAMDHWSSYGELLSEYYDIDDEETRNQLQVIKNLRTIGKDKFYDYAEYFGTGNKVNYFCDKGLSPKHDVTFFDVGACMGETIEPVRLFYGDRLIKTYAFEPDSNNRDGLLKYIETKRIKDAVVIYEYALGDKDSEVRFSSDKMASAITDEGDITVQCARLDSLSDIKVYGDPMLKMDIEGAELAALNGMENFIKKYEPYLAICLYHKVDDIYEIPRYLRSLVPDYRFYFRGGYHLECWAVPRRHFQN